MRSAMAGILVLLPCLSDANEARSQTTSEQYEVLLKQHDTPTGVYVNGRLKKEAKAVSERFLMLARQQPGDSAAADALGWVVTHSVFSPEAEEAMSLLARNHVKSEKLASIIRRIDRLYGGPFEPIEKLCLRGNHGKSSS